MNTNSPTAVESGPNATPCASRPGFRLCSISEALSDLWFLFLDAWDNRGRKEGY